MEPLLHQSTLTINSNIVALPRTKVEQSQDLSLQPFSSALSLKPSTLLLFPLHTLQKKHMERQERKAGFGSEEGGGGGRRYRVLSALMLGSV